MENTHRPRGRPRRFDRTAVLDRAVSVFHAKGFDGASMADLCAATGLNPPSLYAAFGDKRRLWAEALTRFQDRDGAYAARAIEQEPSARAALARLLFEAAEALARPDAAKGCLVVAGSFLSQDDEAHADAKRCRDAAAEAIRARLLRAQEEGELGPDADVEALARFYVTVLQGMTVQARDGAAPADLRAVAELALRAWPSP